MKQILLANNKGIALVDDEDHELLSKSTWFVLKGRTCYYATRHVGKKPHRTTQLMHRLIMNAQKGQRIDHRDNDGLNNQKSNLRSCTNSQNAMNQKKTRGTSKYKGVSWSKVANKWRVTECWLLLS